MALCFKFAKSIGIMAVAGLFALAGCAERDTSVYEPDISPPLVGSVSEDGGRITWETDESAFCVVLYGAKQGIYDHYGYNVYDGGTQHYVDFIDIDPGSYYVRVIATDLAGNTWTGDEMLLDIDEVPPSENLLYTMVDVGWGDCHFLEFPNGTNVMVDAGWGAIGEYDHALDVDQFLVSRGIPGPGRTIDYMVATHNHGDHYGGFLGLVARFPNTRFLAAGEAFSSVWDTMDDLLESVGVERDSLDEGQTSASKDFLNWDAEHGTQVKVLSAGAGRFVGSEQEADPGNNDSVVLKITYGEVDILLNADAEEFVEQRMVKTYGRELDCEVLKVGHHANDDASSVEFLEVATPRVGLITNSLEENEGVFDQVIINRLLAYDVDYYVSDRSYRNASRYDDPQHGNITVTTNGETFVVWSWE